MTIEFYGTEIVRNNPKIVQNGRRSGGLARVSSWSALCQRVADSGQCVLRFDHNQWRHDDETGTIGSSVFRIAMNDVRYVGRRCLVAEQGRNEAQCGHSSAGDGCRLRCVDDGGSNG